ncbi:MAG: inorganic phosphate transporter, partial [Halobacteriales archaeon]
MVATSAIVTLIVAGVASFFMAWTIGAGSSGSTPFAPAVGANAISILRAGFVVGILGLLGAVTQGANVSEAVGEQLVRGAPLSPAAAVTALLIAATLVAVGVFSGYPIATAFTVTGAVVGAGLAIGRAPNWPKYLEIVSLWVATPLVGGGVAYATARTLRTEAVPESVAVPALGGGVGAILANVEFVFLDPPGESAALTATAVGELPTTPAVAVAGTTLLAAAATAGALAVAMRDPERGQRWFLLALGGLVAFSAGGTQVGLAVGPLLPVLGATSLPWQVPLMAVLVFGGVGLLVGSWTG